MPGNESESGEPELDAAHVDAAWEDILANYGERPTMPPLASPEAVVPEEEAEPIAQAAPEPEAAPEWWEREEHFTPPEPPPAPIPAGPRGLAWAGALATYAHTEQHCEVGAAVAHETGWTDERGFHPYNSNETLPPETALLWSNDPRIWRRWR